MKKILGLAIIASSMMLVGCETTRPDNSGLINGEYAGVKGVNDAQGLELSSQIFGAENMSSEEVKQMKADLMKIDCRSVYFGFDSNGITDDAKHCLDETADYLIAHPNQPIKLSGNTDVRGSEKYNFNLGQRRADAVYTYLKDRNVNEDQMCVVSFGKLKPSSEPTKFYDEFCTDGLNDTCMYKAAEKSYYLDRRTELDFGVKCN